MADFPVTRAGAILAVSDFGASLRFIRVDAATMHVERHERGIHAS